MNSFIDILQRFLEMEYPDKIRDWDEIVESGEIRSPQEFGIIYNGLTEGQKYRAVRLLFRKSLKEGVTLKGIIKSIEE